MLVMAMIFLANILLATVAVWAYRKVSRARKKQHTVLRNQQPKTRMKLRDKQGYISISPRAQKKNLPYRSGRKGNLQAANGKNKAPWGW